MKKLNLSGLKVQSFVTSVENTSSLKGGSDTPNTHETVDSVCATEFCTVDLYVCTTGTTRRTDRCNNTTATSAGYYVTNQVECLG